MNNTNRKNLNGLTKIKDFNNDIGNKKSSMSKSGINRAMK
jgi:hypothetical protein